MHTINQDSTVASFQSQVAGLSDKLYIMIILNSPL